MINSQLDDINIIEGETSKSNFIRSNNGKIKLIIKTKIIKASTLLKLENDLNYIKNIKYKGQVLIKFKSNYFADDASILVLESIIYKALNKYQLNIKLIFEDLIQHYITYPFFKKSIINESIDNNIFNANKFQEFFKKKNNIKSDHLRKYLCLDKIENTINTQSIVFQDVFNFLQILNFEKQYSIQISQTISEIIDNVFSHAKSDAILTIKVINVKNLMGENKKALSVCILNLTNKMLYTNLKEKINSENFNKKAKNIIESAYNNNKDKLNQEFDLDSFYFISAFQKNVTSREKTIGGLGLTVLLKNLMDSSYDDFCYVISGSNCLFFKKNYLKLNDDGTIGFNAENSYYNNIPDNNNFKKLKYTLNGTLYCLTFIS